MDDAEPVRMDQRQHHRDDQLDRPTGRHRFTHQASQGPAFEVLEDHIGLALHLVDLVNDDDVLVAATSGRPGLDQEPLGEPRRAVGEKLDRHPSRQPGVARQVHGSHATAPDLTEQLVLAESSPRRRRRCNLGRERCCICSSAFPGAASAPHGGDGTSPLAPWRDILATVFVAGSGARMVAISGVILGLLVASPAHSDELPSPWAKDVSQADQSQAKALFEAGNQLLEQNLFGPALELYRNAIERWDHPGIRYNAAVALINLERPIEAFENLEAALRYGESALDRDIYQQARSYERLLRGQIVRFQVECAQPDVQVALDGRDFMRCPGNHAILALPGEHQLVASRTGFVTRTLPLILTGGETRHITIQLMTLEQATFERRRWSWWKPWVVVGGGAALGAIGLGLELQARATFQSYDNAVAVLCPDRPCDELPGVVTDAYDRGRLQNRVGVGFLVAGGAALAGGLVWAALNRPVTEHLGYDHSPAIAPAVGPNQVGVTLGGRF